MVVALSSLIIFAAFLGQAIFGFGGGLLAIPLLSIMVPVHEAVTIVLCFQLLAGVLVFEAADHLSWSSIKPIVLGMLGGCALGVIALAWTPEKMLEILLLLSILFFLVKRRFLPTAQFPKLGHAKWASAIGGLSGFVQGTTGTGGPLLIMYVSACLPDSKQIRVTVMLLLLISNLVRLLISIPVQLFSPLALQTIGVALPGFLLALFLGPKIFKSVSDEFYVKFIDFVLILSCMTLIWKLLYA